MKIDIYAHILPEQYRINLMKEIASLSSSREMANRANRELETRLRLMDRFPEVLQVLTLSLPPLDNELGIKPKKAMQLAKAVNDEVAEIVAQHPDKFVAAVACLPLNDMDAALVETDRAIKELGFKGVQLFARVNGEQLDSPRYQ